MSYDLMFTTEMADSELSTEAAKYKPGDDRPPRTLSRRSEGNPEANATLPQNHVKAEMAQKLGQQPQVSRIDAEACKEKAREVAARLGNLATANTHKTEQKSTVAKVHVAPLKTPAKARHDEIPPAEERPPNEALDGTKAADIRVSHDQPTLVVSGLEGSPVAKNIQVSNISKPIVGPVADVSDEKEVNDPPEFASESRTLESTILRRFLKLLLPSLKDCLNYQRRDMSCKVTLTREQSC